MSVQDRTVDEAAPSQPSLVDPDHLGKPIKQPRNKKPAMIHPSLPKPTLAYQTQLGSIYCGDSLQLLRKKTLFAPSSVNLIMTSPPFGLVRQKAYGNVSADDYVQWFKPFAKAFYKALADNGSFVIDIGGSWIPGQPTRSLYHYELLLMLCKEIGFHLAQEFFWYNPSRLPTPAEWVTVRRIRVKDAVNCVWWLSKSPWPKASNTRVLQPYSPSMLELLKSGYKAKLRPSGHDISEHFNVDNGAAIASNLIPLANTESNSAYLRSCQERGIKPHPARYPATLPEFFIRMLTDQRDLVVDPFAGSCVTGEVAERLGRRWICGELRADYVQGALGRFVEQPPSATTPASAAGVTAQLAFTDMLAERRDVDALELPEDSTKFYKFPRPGLLWDDSETTALRPDGGRSRQMKPSDVPNEATPDMEEMDDAE